MALFIVCLQAVSSVRLLFMIVIFASIALNGILLSSEKKQKC